jgi:hypothetical protein
LPLTGHYTSDRSDLCRVNFEVNKLKPFPHLAFPHFATPENTSKQLGFDGELMASFLPVLPRRLPDYWCNGDISTVDQQASPV